MEIVNSNRTTQQILYEFLNFELKIIQQFEKFSYIIESINEENPVKDVSLQEDTLVSDNNFQLTHISSSFNEVQVDTEISNFSYNSYLETDINKQTHSEISRNDLDHIMNSFRSVSQKLGLNDQNLSSMKNFYAKPTNVSFDTPSTSQSVQFNCNDPDTDQIPEKDLTPCRKTSTNVLISTVEKGIEQKSNLFDAELNYHDSEEDRTMKSVNESVTSEEPCPLGFGAYNLDNSNEIAITNNQYTALQKLNNLQQMPKDMIVDIKPLDIPDLTLKATKYMNSTDATTPAQNAMVIRNFKKTKKQVKNKTNFNKALNIGKNYMNFVN